MMITITVFQRTLRGDWQEDDPTMRNQRWRSLGHHFGSCGARDDDDRNHESIMPVNSVNWFHSCFNSIDIGIIIRIEL